MPRNTPKKDPPEPRETVKIEAELDRELANSLEAALKNAEEKLRDAYPDEALEEAVTDDDVIGLFREAMSIGDG